MNFELSAYVAIAIQHNPCSRRRVEAIGCGGLHSACRKDDEPVVGALIALPPVRSPVCSHNDFQFLSTLSGSAGPWPSCGIPRGVHEVRHSAGRLKTSERVMEALFALSSRLDREQRA